MNELEANRLSRAIEYQRFAAKAHKCAAHYMAAHYNSMREWGEAPGYDRYLATVCKYQFTAARYARKAREEMGVA